MNNQLIVKTITFTYDDQSEKFLEVIPSYESKSMYEPNKSNEQTDKLELEQSEYSKYRHSRLIKINKTITKLTESDSRNAYIINTIDHIRKIKNGKILVLSDRVEHLKVLKNRIDALIQRDNTVNVNCKTYLYIVGNTTNEYRSEAIEQGNIIFTTYAMTNGLFIDKMHTIMFASPKMNVSYDLEIILRNIKEHLITTSALVIDFVDDLPILKHLTDIRKQIYLRPKYMRYSTQPIETTLDNCINYKIISS